jgi:hypothetical protein
MPKPWRDDGEILLYKEAMAQAGDTTQDEVMRALDLFGKKVLPKFQ